ncbi:MAG: permease [Peptostreptococcaceae bacterium]|jgi:uncharacterized membrane protein YraQ (UPF0718 family)|nr:permease [Peptostreptococcaceae bacterium]
MSTYIIYGIVFLLLIVSSIKDGKKTKKALKMGLKSFTKLLPSMIPMFLIIGIVLSFVSPKTISMILGKDSGFIGVVIGIITGSIAFLPSFVAFPLGVNLLNQGAGYPQIAAFISSLMAVGIASIGLEMSYFGKETAILRNILGIVVSIIFALIIWVVM